MGKIKKIILLVLALLPILGGSVCFLVPFYRIFSPIDEKKDDSCLGISVINPHDATLEIHPFKNGESYVIIIPSYWDIKQLELVYGKDSLSTDNFELGIPQKVKDIEIVFFQSTQKTVSVHTKSGSIKHVDASIDKSEKEKGLVSFISLHGDTIVTEKMKSISGRGNWTWKRYKKPYNIKISEKRQIFGLKETNTFALLSNYSDYSNLRNWIAFKVGAKLGMPFPLGTEYVSLWIDGDYRGLYLLSEKPEVSETGVDIDSLETRTIIANSLNNKKDLNLRTVFDDGSYIDEETSELGQYRGYDWENNPADISGGYLIEPVQGFRKTNNAGFRVHGELCVDINYPKHPSLEQVCYIKDFYTEMQDAVENQNGVNEKTKKHYTEYIDIQSFVDYYLMQEVFLNSDGGIGSFKMFKNSNRIDSLLYAGPLWDMDLTMGRGKEELHPESNGLLKWPEWGVATYPECLLMSEDVLYQGINLKSRGLMKALVAHKDFENRLKDTYNLKLRPILYEVFWGATVDSIRNKIYPDVMLDNYRNRNLCEYELFDKSIDNMKSFMKRRIDFLDRIWNDSLKGYHKVSLDIGKNGTGHYRKIGLYVRDGEIIDLPEIHMNKRLMGIYSDSGDIIDLSEPVRNDMNLKFVWSSNLINIDYWKNWLATNKQALYGLVVFLVSALIDCFILLYSFLHKRK